MPRYDRDEVARRAGYGSWREAVTATADLSQQQAGAALGVSHPTIRTWRLEAGVAVATRRSSTAESSATFRADPTDPRHGTDNGYRNLGCRCGRCTGAWADYLRERRERVRSDESDPEHG